MNRYSVRAHKIFIGAWLIIVGACVLSLHLFFPEAAKSLRDATFIFTGVDAHGVYIVLLAAVSLMSGLALLLTVFAKKD